MLRCCKGGLPKPGTFEHYIQGGNRFVSVRVYHGTPHDAAADLLKENGIKIKDIACRVGYNNVQCFQRLFKILQHDGAEFEGAFCLTKRANFADKFIGMFRVWRPLPQTAPFFYRKVISGTTKGYCKLI